MDPAFGAVRSRWLLVWFVLSTVLAAVVLNIGASTADDAARQWQDASFIWVDYGLLALLLLAHARRAGLSTRSVFGRFPARRSALRLASLGVPAAGIAVLCIYVTFAPLSFAWPDAVQWLLFEDVPIFYSAGPPYPLLGNIAGVLSVVLVAPVVEEYFFRGLLLRRWTHKWGPVRAVVASSVLFGILHADVVGALLFAIAMCALYAHYRSLWPSIIVHAANNAIAAVMMVLAAHGGLGSQLDPVTVEQLRAAWWMPVIGGLVAIPWLWNARRFWQPISGWRFETARAE